jgi:murein L,D-transpeptidase YcbB/YkuD
MLWIPEECRVNRQILLQYLLQSDSLGLNKADYNFELLQQTNITDSVNTDRRITLSAIQFFHDVVYGKDIPRFEYNGLNYTPGCIDISQKFYASLEQGNFENLLQELEPGNPEYKNIKKLLGAYLKKLADSTLHPGLVTSYLVDSTNHPLIERLYQLGYLDSLNYRLPEKTVRAKLREAQYMFELYEDGGLRPNVFEALNIPLIKRVAALKESLNIFRWLQCFRDSQQIIVINIPAANLFLYDGDSTILSSRIVVGKPLTPTPTLCSKVTQLILFPYWTVPHSIATKELLPAIKNNIPYLDAGNYQVLDKQGNILDPYRINWKALSPKYFPYTIRQANGCDNSLGIMKLNFFNPYDVYLHDTPWKNFFAYNKRYFSHGCMRVEKAMELAKAVMPSKAAEIDSLGAMCIAPDGKPVAMSLQKAVPVFILYQLAWPDEKGMIRFFEDAYHKK